MEIVVIDPLEKTVTSLKSDKPINQIIGCEYIEMVSLGQGHCLWIDEEGALKKSLPYFQLQGFPYPLYGKAVITSLHHGTEGSVESANEWIEFFHRSVAWTQSPYADLLDHLLKDRAVTINREENNTRYLVLGSAIAGRIKLSKLSVQQTVVLALKKGMRDDELRELAIELIGMENNG